MSGKFFACEVCGNIAGKVHDSGVPLVCCGRPMKELAANSTDAAGEKHVPVVEVQGNQVIVNIGSVAHPMTEAHLITWVCLETAQGWQREPLTANDAPSVVFALADGDSVKTAYAYCNLHGLWKADV